MATSHYIKTEGFKSLTYATEYVGAVQATLEVASFTPGEYKVPFTRLTTSGAILYKRIAQHILDLRNV